MPHLKRLGILLLLASMLTFLWLLVCPGYIIQGPTSHMHRVSGDLPGTYTYVDRNHPEPTYFWGGTFLIFSFTTSFYFLTLHVPNLAHALKQAIDGQPPAPRPASPTSVSSP